ncbi:MAG: phosphoribosylanthranilate isomerase [Planctomycetaceae bacterium]|nr:phosphoribosylanthranilate isomerase [Planctomycetaceae bacterium]
MWVKICGVRDVSTAACVAAFRPDAIGLNFYPPSPRYVEPTVAAQITAQLPAEIEAIGVFVHATAKQAHEIAAIVRQIGLSGVQFHGTETPNDIAAVIHACPPGIKAIRSWTPDGEWMRLPRYVEDCRALGVEIAAILMDAHAPSQYGGTGKTVDWPALRSHYDTANWPPLLLAGGLKPENIADAIHSVQPWGVDVASGVESSPGVKDPERVQAFITNARAF